MLSGTTLAVSVLGFALVTGCGGRSNSPRADLDATDHLAGNGGQGVASPESGAGTDAGGASSTVGGAAGSAGRSASGDSAGGAADAGSPGTTGNGGSSASAGGEPGAAGEPGAGTGGAAGGAGSNSAAVAAACTSLCTGWIHDCSIWQFSETCTSDCSSDVVVQNGACADLGRAMLSCMTATSGSGSNNLCTTPFAAGISACQAKVDAFRACTAGGGAAPQPNICMRAGNSFSDGGCAENRFCLDNVSSELKCAKASDGKSTCDCWNYNLTTQLKSSTTFTFDEQSGDLCLNHMDECLASRGTL